MDLFIAKSTPVTFEEGSLIEHPVRWILEDLCVYSFPFSLPSPGELLDYAEKKTVGSFPWMGADDDAVRFDKETLELSAFIIVIPPHTPEFPPDWSSWLSSEPLEGRLKLRQSADYFSVEIGDYNSVLPDPAHLILLNEDGLGVGSKTRVRVARDFDALFLNGHLVGWLLSDPLSHVVQTGVNPVETPHDVELMGVLAELVQMQTEEGFALVWDRDSATHLRLAQMRRALETRDVTSVPVRAMLGAIDHLANQNT